MNKENKKLVLIILLLLLITISYSTYAIYKSSASGTGNVTTAGWHVEVGSDDITSQSASFSFTGANITWTTNTSAVSGKIAPGSSGIYNIALDATGSEVPITYEISNIQVKVNNSAVSNNAGLTVVIASSDTGKLAYAATNMSKNIPIQVTWTGTDSDADSKNTADINIAGQNVVITFDLIVKQDLNP